VALEFCSRGAKQVTAIDFNRKSIAYIKDVADKLAVDNLLIKQSKVLSYLKNNTEKFDVIFADPPYNATREIQELIQVLSQGDFLTSDGIFILEHQTMTQINHDALVESRNYGQSTFSFFKFVNTHE
jgi:16S rRNA G966 N2-methylase RsmD